MSCSAVACRGRRGSATRSSLRSASNPDRSTSEKMLPSPPASGSEKSPRKLHASLETSELEEDSLVTPNQTTSRLLPASAGPHHSPQRKILTDVPLKISTHLWKTRPVHWGRSFGLSHKGRVRELWLYKPKLLFSPADPITGPRPIRLLQKSQELLFLQRLLTNLTGRPDISRLQFHIGVTRCRYRTRKE